MHLIVFLGPLGPPTSTHYYHWGLKGIWWALLAWIVCRALVLMVKFRKDYYPLALAQKN